MEFELPSSEGESQDTYDLLKEDSGEARTTNEADEGTEKTDKSGDGESESKEKEIKLEGHEDDEDEDEDEDEEGEPDDDEEEEGLKFQDNFPRKKEILKEFPNLFKKFPGIEHAIYRDRQFTEVFATPEDARDAALKSEQLDVFSDDLFRGNMRTILKTVADNDIGAFHRIVDNFFENVGAIEPAAYHHVIGNIVKFTIMAMAEEAKQNNDQELMDHASALNKFVFKSSKWEPPTNLAKKGETDENRELQREREDRVRERFTEANDGLQKKVDNTILATIGNYIDPKKEMTEYVKKHAVQDAFKKLETVLQNDRSLRSTLDRLWKAAAEDRFSSSSLDKIRAAYLSKAKAQLRDVIKSARIDALGHSRRRVSSDNSQERDRRGHAPVGRPAGSSGNGRGKLEIPKGMSNKDFIMGD